MCIASRQDDFDKFFGFYIESDFWFCLKVKLWDCFVEIARLNVVSGILSLPVLPLELFELLELLVVTVVIAVTLILTVVVALAVTTVVASVRVTVIVAVV